jgi:hypothetical protein
MSMQGCTGLLIGAAAAAGPPDDRRAIGAVREWESFWECLAGDSEGHQLAWAAVA